jgi:hypothetical protein
VWTVAPAPNSSHFAQGVDPHIDESAGVTTIL